MKRLSIILITLIYLLPQNITAQKNTDAIVGVATGLLAIGAGIAAVEQMKEQAELNATEWLINNHPEFNQFSLKTLDFDGKKLKDLSSTSVISYKIQEFDIEERELVMKRKTILLGFTSYGWVNEYGINFEKVLWFLIDTEEWVNMMTAYTKVASGENDESKIKNTLRKGKVVNKGIKSKEAGDIDFYRMRGDEYLVTEYSDEMKFIYNERSLGIYLKETKNLIQMGRGDLIKIHEFFFED